MLVSFAGAVTGDNIGFAIGHHYGRATLLRLGKYSSLHKAFQTYRKLF
jgi:membrane protein DedA with SNARE-associated domain